jgi:membrane-associated phospholipid phosphatase
MSAGAQPRAAAKQVLAGEPKQAARAWLGWISLAAFVLFVADTYVVLSGLVRSSFDIPVEHAVQAFPWGPLTCLMQLSNASGGLPQVLLGAGAIIAMFIYERRAGWLLALGAIASVLDSGLKASVQRHRPTADIVKILSPNSGYSYASGHAVFFTWLCFMLAASFAPRLNPRWRAVTWAAALAVIVVVCLGRVWAGAHWPSDVVGGFLLGLAWAAFVLWLPERWLPSPSWRWVPWRRRAVHAG